MLAQTFLFAADVLEDERRRGSSRFHLNVGQPLDGDAWKRTQTGPAAFFCKAFAVELAIKAALVSQGALRALESGDRLPFAVHGLADLAASIEGLTLSPADQCFLREISDLITNGKYPAPLRPSDSLNGAPVVNDYAEFADRADSIYYLFMALLVDRADA